MKFYLEYSDWLDLSFIMYIHLIVLIIQDITFFMIYVFKIRKQMPIHTSVIIIKTTFKNKNILISLNYFTNFMYI